MIENNTDLSLFETPVIGKILLEWLGVRIWGRGQEKERVFCVVNHLGFLMWWIYLVVGFELEDPPIIEELKRRPTPKRE